MQPEIRKMAASAPSRVGLWVPRTHPSRIFNEVLGCEGDPRGACRVAQDHGLKVGEADGELAGEQDHEPRDHCHGPGHVLQSRGDDQVRDGKQSLHQRPPSSDDIGGLNVDLCRVAHHGLLDRNASLASCRRAVPGNLRPLARCHERYAGWERPRALALSWPSSWKGSWERWLPSVVAGLLHGGGEVRCIPKRQQLCC